MKHISYKNVIITDGFWKTKQELNRKITINAVWNRFYDTGRIDAFLFNWKEGMPNQPHFFWDSDVAKWMEAAAYIIAKEPDPALSEKIELLIDRIEKNQDEDGYFNIYFTVVDKNRFAYRGLHELYCAGHLIEAAVAYFEATGKRRFLSLMEKYVDCIYRVFFEEKSATFETPGHEEIELALIKLYKCTENEKYLRLAEFFINTRGNSEKDRKVKPDNLLICYDQSHLPVREQTEALGHSVRAMYLYSGMADLAEIRNDLPLICACEKLFADVTERKMYVTGGLGQTSLGEAFTVPYDLPNEHAYAETCAAIGLMFFCDRMNSITDEAKYADICELALYNGMLSGLSLDGKSFFYENPLEINICNHSKNTSTTAKERYPITQRKEVFDCSCCPPNLNRILASLGGYIYGIEKGRLYINQFISSVAECDGIHVTQKTDFPHSGKIEITTDATSFCVRIPSWCSSFTADKPFTRENGYAVFTGGSATISMDMTPVLLEANPRVAEDAGKAVLKRGPVVYCLESVDNGDIASKYVNSTQSFETSYDSFFGADTIIANGYIKEGISSLYAPISKNFTPVRLKYIPYFGFANRGEADMKVFVNLR